MKKSYLLFVLITSIMLTNCGSSKNVVKVDPYLGAWSLLIESTPQGDVSATMTITKNAEGAYSGSVTSDVGAFDLYDLKIVDSKLSAGFMIQEAEFDLIGNLENLLFRGYVSGMGEDYKANGNKMIE
ncbi:hypothetical protein LX77_02828 [Gelidibacter algens]|jgi:hypothetical protein|uniref:Uncharacterized protein n=1 Tax=Gelidibacter algens TaxID=49280 RepID=A0A1A7R1N2_9FLAO|nr:hypothetical protein [Gelidibacter algens]OBX25731.1 hypothetical protein A9996_08250 [Gelidibacter algens]RAJ21074.1 hypothetical protein LX77_02828 [Gelidibacter algens]